MGRVRYKGDRKGFFPLNRVRDLAELKMLERLAREEEARRRRTPSINTQATPAGGAAAAAAAAAVSTGQQEEEEEPGASASLAARWAQEGGYGGGGDGGVGQLVRGYGQELQRVAVQRLGSALEDSRSEVEMAALAVARRGAEITSEAQAARRQQRVQRRVAIARRRSHRRHVAAV
eukprot:COSAG01_NODE_751_length_13837_cov_78.727981_17_plen_176_part_00